VDSVLVSPAQSVSESPREALWTRSAREKTALLAFVFLVPYAIARSLFAASARPLWFDEIITVTMARLPNLRALWDALARAADGNPPVFYTIERLAVSLSRNELVAYRLPSILGFAVTLVCVFVFIRKRDGNEVAAVCAGGLLITTLYGVYAIEARPYSLMVACVALALVCYQHAPKTGWVVLMGCALALSETLHYYAVFGLVPFGIAEAALSLRTRTIRWGVWLALTAGVLPLVVLWPLLDAIKKAFGAHFWAEPAPWVVVGTFFWIWDVPWFLQLPIAGTLLHRFAYSFGTLRAGLSQSAKPRQNVPAQPWIHERLLAFGLLGLPFVVFVIAALMHGGFSGRYMIAAVLGFPLASAYCLSRLDHKKVRLISLLVLSAVIAHEGYSWFDRKQPVGYRAPVASVRKLVDSAGHGSLPVVVSDVVTYLPIVHYGAPEWAKRFVFLTDASEELHYSRTDSASRELILLSRYIPLQLYEYRAFTSRHKVFLLYSDGNGHFDWWPLRFTKEGYSIRTVAEDGPSKIYLVDLDQRLHRGNQ
jgi:hypothetical protein